MPHSYNELKDWMLEKYLVLKPESVIDIGIGAGTYAKLMRPHFTSHWTGVEVWGPYIERFNLLEKYDRVIIADIVYLDFAAIRPRPALAIAGDVMEHLPRDVAQQQIERLQAWVDDILISIPLGAHPQGTVAGNSYEQHLATWEHEDMLAALGPGVVNAVKGRKLGCYHWSRRSFHA